MLKKRLLAGACVLTLLFGSGSILPQGFSFIDRSIVSAAASINTTEVTIYHLESNYEDVLSMPDNFEESFQLTVSGAKNVSYRLGSGDASIAVSDTGLVTVNPSYWYWYGYMGYSWKVEGQEPDEITENVKYGDRTIIVTADSETYNVTVHLEDYSDIYYYQVVDDYISKNIRSDMTDMEKMKAIAAFPASYVYNARYQGGKSMVLYGGGDCWASTNLIVDTCHRLGIEAWGRNGNRDPGAGSGHRNAMAYLNGVYYELEAGYGYSTAPRPYDVTVRNSLYSYRSISNPAGIEVYQYDGKENPEVLEIPSQIGGKNVVSIGKSFISLEDGIKKVVVPEGVESIKDSAFNTVYDLEEIILPSTLKTLGSFVFTNNSKLKTISIPASNPYFTVENGVVYNKDKTELLYASNCSEVNIPSTVKKIADYAFYYNMNITSITVPASVTEIGIGAFCTCSSLKDITFEGKNLTSLGYAMFADCSSLESLTLPEGLTELGQYALRSCGKLKSVIIPDSVTTIDKDAFGNNPEDMKIYCNSGSSAETFASDNGLNYILLDKLQPGDTNTDYTVNMKDLVLFQRYLNSWDVSIYLPVCDLYPDGRINMKDYVKLQQMLNGWA